MKTRKTNRAKQVAGSCSNHGSCPVCVGNRTYANRHAEPAPEGGLEPEVDEKICAWCHSYLVGTTRYKRFGDFYCSMKCACSTDGLPPTEADVAFLDAYTKAPSLTCKLFQAVADDDFVPITDHERADALKRGREDREAADAELPAVTVSGRRYR